MNKVGKEECPSKEAALEYLNKYAATKRDMGYTFFPIKDDVVKSTTKDGEITEYTFIYLIKIAYSL